jgi:hypothetical protein
MCDDRIYNSDSCFNKNNSIDNDVKISYGPDILSFSNINNCKQLSVKSICEEDNNEQEQSITNIYRYKFTDEFTSELFKFSKIHQYDHRKDFKKAWLVWLDLNEELVESESRRLTNLSYIGDINDKMFKSARYYFRKKSTEKKAPIQRRCYIQVQKELLEAIDNHIRNMIISNETKPSDGFDDFCKNNKEALNIEVQNLYQSGMRDATEIKNKIKKTYKNRYFLIISK